MPTAAVAIQVAGRAIGDDFYKRWVHGEQGLVENLTALFLVIAVVVALRLFAHRRRVASRLFGPFALVMAAGCFFFAGEEASAGANIGSASLLPSSSRDATIRGS